VTVISGIQNKEKAKLNFINLHFAITFFSSVAIYILGSNSGALGYSLLKEK